MSSNADLSGEKQMQDILIVVNALAYGGERTLSALRLATAIVSQETDARACRVDVGRWQSHQLVKS